MLLEEAHSQALSYRIKWAISQRVSKSYQQKGEEPKMESNRRAQVRKSYNKWRFYKIGLINNSNSSLLGKHSSFTWRLSKTNWQSWRNKEGSQCHMQVKALPRTWTCPTIDWIQMKIWQLLINNFCWGRNTQTNSYWVKQRSWQLANLPYQAMAI